ncbi:MAG TPA: hypothetical protein VID03_07060 [Acidimicrobiia bacterium]
MSACATNTTAAPTADTAAPIVTTSNLESVGTPALARPVITRAAPSDPAAPADFFVGPVASGDGSGRGQSDAAAFAHLGRLIAAAPPGTVIELAADQGVYELSKPITIAGGGEVDSPITIRGPLDGPRPVLRGERTDPYDPQGETGSPAFRLEAGADHLVFALLECERVGNGCFNVVGDISDLTLQSITARNVRRFLDTGTESGARDASVTGLTVAEVRVEGFSKGVIRLGSDSHDVLIQDVVGDSQGQDGDNFAIGVHLVDSVHDVRLERVTMSNALDTLHDYWNGDGFATERDVFRVHLVGTEAANNSDAGYDLKSSSTVLEDVTAAGNKRNYRLWGEDMVVADCSGLDPLLRGGTGSPIQVQVLESAEVWMENCTFADSASATVVFSVEGTSSLELRDVDVEHSASGELSSVAGGADLTQFQVKVSTG